MEAAIMTEAGPCVSVQPERMSDQTVEVPPHVNSVVVVADNHTGCKLGLCPPEGARQDDGGPYLPSPLQLVVWEMWEYFWNVFVPEATHGEPFDMVHNGDCVDGDHHRSTTQFSHNLDDQGQCCVAILRPKVARARRYYHVRGTEAHVEKSAREEERVARELGAVPNEVGQHARWELWMDLRGHLIHFLHHIGTTNSAAHEASAVNAELTAEFAEAARWNMRRPDCIVRSHRHRAIEVRIPVENGYATAAVTAAWQLKMLALDTPLPTTAGWTTMGKVKNGDVLFDERGDPCTVIAAHPVHPGPESFEVHFGNGETVKACAEHLWLTTATVARPGTPGHGGERRPPTRVRTTREIYETLLCGRPGRHNHKLFMPGPLQLAEQRLPVDPYVLGCWLGDGDSACARLSCHANDVPHFSREFRRAGYHLSPQSVKDKKCPRFAIQKMDAVGVVVGKKSEANLQAVLRRGRLLDNKHIPAVYLRSSCAQRVALLQGLLDTDGHPDRLGRAIFFTTTLPRLRDGVAELLASLGIKFSLVRRAAKLAGHPKANDFWLFRFFISPDVIPVFRLGRKLRLVPLASSRKSAQRSRSVFITSVVPCAAVPMRCIAVDSPSRLYRFGKTMLYTHNTPFCYKIAGARLAPPQIGGLVIRVNPDTDEIYTRSWVREIKRPPVVIA